MAKGGALVDVLLVIIVVALLLILLYMRGLLPSSISGIISGIVGNGSPFTLPGNLSATTTIAQNSVQTNAQLEQYALGLINNDRHQFGLPNVTLSSESSAQQHSQSMLTYGYFSHWDIYGMKPYMRYTLLGGTQSVSENVAFRQSYDCLASYCRGNVNVQQALQQMEYAMMYNDSVCCNNGHRDNILNPQHNQVSIGIAYNQSTVYFTEDFIDSYANWSQGTPNYSGGEVYLSGSLPTGYTVSSVEVSYDQPVTNMTRAQLANTSSYGYGQQIAGVVRSPVYYYQGLTTIVADHYSTSGSTFSISFSMQKLITQYQAGEYTVMLWLNGTQSSNFIGSTYTIFIGSSGQPYAPANV